MGICSGPSCNRSVSSGGRGLCYTHNLQAKNGEELRVIREKLPNGSAKYSTCNGPECNKKSYAKGLCVGHYYQKSRTGRMVPLKEFSKRANGAALKRNDLGEKQCADCRDWLPESLYSSIATTSSLDGLNHTCNICRKYQRIENLYGISRERYKELLLFNGGGCYICGETERTLSRPLCVDHDHSCCPGERSCGKCVRGILCNRHNMALGHVRDSRDELSHLIDYLDQLDVPGVAD